MGNRPNVNRKLRAKKGRLKYRLNPDTLNPLYHERNERKALLRRATDERIRLEREREYYVTSRTGPRRFEEDEALALWLPLAPKEFQNTVPSVHAIMQKMEKGKWPPNTARS